MFAAPLLRLSLRAAPSYVSGIRSTFGDGSQKALLADVEARLGHLGHRDVRTIMQDPTDPTTFTAIVRASGSALAHDAALRIVRVERVEEPKTVREDASAFDPGLSAEDAWVLRKALAEDENPRHLDGIATTFENFPTSASLLRAKALLLELRAPRHKAFAFEDARRTGLPMATVAVPTGAALRNLTRTMLHGRWPEVERMWLRFGAGAPRAWPKLPDPSPSDVAFAHRHLLTFTRGDLSFEPVRDEVRVGAATFAAEPFERIHGWLSPLERDPIRDAGRAAVVEIGLAVRIVCPLRMREILPPDERDGFVSPSSAQLALAQMKPGYSRVRHGGNARRMAKELDVARPGTPGERDRLRAKAQIDRATKAIERQRWIEWYKRVCACGCSARKAA